MAGDVTLYQIVRDPTSSFSGIQTIDANGNLTGPVLYQFPGAARDAFIIDDTFYLQHGTTGYALDPSGQNFMEISDNGDVRLQAAAGLHTINQGTSPNVEYGAAITVNYRLADGSLTSENIGFAKTAPTGKRWAVWTDAFGETHLQAVDITKTLTELNAQFPIYQRWATSQEVQDRLFAGEMFRLMRSDDPLDRDRFERIAEENGFTSDQLQAQGSGAVDAFVRASVGSMAAARRYVFAAR